MKYGCYWDFEDEFIDKGLKRYNLNGYWRSIDGEKHTIILTNEHMCECGHELGEHTVEAPCGFEHCSCERPTVEISKRQSKPKIHGIVKNADWDF